MKLYKAGSFLAVAALAAITLTGCATSEENKDIQITQSPTYGSEAGEEDTVLFRPVDCGIQAQKVYEYPFIGLTAVLTDTMLEHINNREVFVFTDENYTAENAVSYAVLHFSAPTEEQKAVEGMSVDIFFWEEALPKVGAIGVYKKDVTEQLNDLTGCDIHKKFGASEDGEYEYYLSTSSQGTAAYIQELEDSVLTISKIHELDLNFGYTAFSTDRLDGVATVGTFTTEDVFGETYTHDIFSSYDLTLVNVLTTWCTYCVEEIPALEKLRQEYADNGIKLGVVAYVMDIETVIGRDESALERAKLLVERSGATFPFLIPDESYLNGRLTGIESVPESFFVDKDGTIVSEPYLGARSQKAWEKIVEDELAKLEDND